MTRPQGYAAEARRFASAPHSTRSGDAASAQPRARWTMQVPGLRRYLLMQLVVNVTYGIAVAAGLYFIGVPNAALRIQPNPTLLISGPANRSYQVEYTDTPANSSVWTTLTKIVTRMLV